MLLSQGLHASFLELMALPIQEGFDLFALYEDLLQRQSKAMKGAKHGV